MKRLIPALPNVIMYYFRNKMIKDYVCKQKSKKHFKGKQETSVSCFFNYPELLEASFQIRNITLLLNHSKSKFFFYK